MTMMAIKNISSQKVFVLLKTHEDKKMTIINPEGKTLTVPDGLFEKPFPVSTQDREQYFEAAQIQAWDKTRTVKKKPAGASKTKAKPQPSRANLEKEWHSERLCFYKHNIEPLKPGETFRVHVDQVGIFEITKEAFEKHFNDVIIAQSYWQGGHYAYDTFPEKAFRYLISRLGAH
jgi:hypothetical protein